MSNLRKNIAEEDKQLRIQMLSQLRRQKREEHLNKRRFQESMEDEETEQNIILPPSRFSNRNIQKEEITTSCVRNPLNEFQQIISDLNKAMNSGNFENQFDALKRLHLFLNEDANASSSFIELSNLIDILLVFIFCPMEEIVLIVFQILILLTMVSGKHIEKLIELNIFEICAKKIMDDESRDIRRHIIHLLGNIAGENEKMRDHLLNIQITNVVLQFAEYYKLDPLMNIDLMFLTSNLCAGRIFVDVNKIVPLIPYIKQNMNSVHDKLSEDAYYTVSFLSQNPSNVEFIVNNGMIDPMLSALQSTNQRCIKLIIEILNNLCENSNEMMIYLIKKAFVSKTKHILKKNYIDNTIYMLLGLYETFIKSEDQNIIGHIIDNVFNDVVDTLLESGSVSIVIPSLWFIMKCFDKSEYMNFTKLVSNKNIYIAIMNIFEQNDDDLLLYGLTMINKLIVFDDQTNKQFDVFESLMQNNLKENIEVLIDLETNSFNVQKQANLIYNVIQTKIQFDEKLNF